MRILVTGHTGFKGAWLSLLLARRGHEVSGLSLDPLTGGVFESARVAGDVTEDLRIDIRDAKAVREAGERLDPELVFHLAAQPLVRQSYIDPRGTFETNVNGTMNVLEALSTMSALRGAIIVTTDKVYRNVGRYEGYAEHEALGGEDPYSASKAMADILTQSWVKSFPGAPVAIGRAGNVIGGGDVSPDRLLVDLIAGFAGQAPVSIRYPDAVRPWQHVLDCLSGYLALADGLLVDGVTGEWNFGPDPGNFQTVRQIADTAAGYWGDGARWNDDSAGLHPPEAGILTLDPTKAQTQLKWRNLLPFPASVEWTLEWHRRVQDGESARDVTVDQIDRFIQLDSAAPWQRTF
jgi:CDP-glucose 4,6-dehydratase